jgi:hypothetical protein
MSDHNWVLENLESYSAGGLDAGERERLEAHLPKCASCSQALQDIRSADEHLTTLFSPIRPQPGFEDRLITSLRTASTRNHFRLPLIGWVGLSAAAAVVLAVVGACMDKVVFGSGRIVARNNLQEVGSVLHSDPDNESSFHSTSLTVSPFGKGKESSAKSEERETSQSVDQLAQNLSELHLSELGDGKPVAVSRDGGGQFYATVTDGTSNTMKVEAPAEAKVPALQEANRPAQTWSYRNDQPAATPPPPGGGSFGGGGFGGGGFGGGGFGGSGGFGWGKQAGAGAGVPQPTTGMLGMQPKPAEPGKDANNGSLQPGFVFGFPAAPNPMFGGKATPFSGSGVQPPQSGITLNVPQTVTLDPETRRKAESASSFSPQANLYNLYFRPGEQAALEKDAKKQVADALDAANKAGDDKSKEKKEVGAERTPGKVNINSIQDNEILAALQNKGDKKENASPEPAMPRKIIIRSGEIEFEVDSFDSAVATITLLVNKLSGGFVATVNSEKLPNGKVRGSVVVRVPPEHLDTLVLDLRKELGKNGELKGQRIGSQDISKQYTDMESRLKAARAMEARLLEIIKTGKGEIKDLLVAEKELGVWRTKIEEYEGEKRYYDNQVSLSTLTITLAEKEIRSPFAVVETERVQMGVEVEDVIKAQQQVLKAVDDAKGRVTKSELKQHAADQLAATINFEVAPDKTGPIRDRIEQLGRRTRLDVDRLQENEGGTGKPGEVKTRRKDTQFFLNLYNVANVAPRETYQLSMACVDVEDVYKKIMARVEKATGRVVTSNLNRQRNDQTSGVIQFEVKTADADAVLVEVRELGEVMRLQVTENADVQNSTRSKRGFLVQLAAMGTVQARETDNIQLATKDVPAGYHALQDAVNKAKGRILNSQLNEQDKQNITAQLDFEIRRTDEPAITAALKAAGDIYSSTLARAQDSDNVIDSKVRYSVTLINQAHIPPRETITLGIEAANVDKTTKEFIKLSADAKGRTVKSEVSRQPSGQVTAKLIFDVPLTSAPEVVNQYGVAGIVRVQRFSKNEQVPDSDLAIARIDVTLSNSPLIVPSDEGFSTELRKGLSTSVRVLSMSLSWLVFGLLVVLPWVLVVYVIYRVVMRMRRRPSPA